MPPSSFPCHLCGHTGAFQGIDTSGELCRISGKLQCTACAELKRVDDKIRETTSLLQKLLGQRHQLKFERNLHHDPLIHRLPLELVSRIFTFYRPHLPNRISKAVSVFQKFSQEKKDDANTTPWQLAIVCQSWRPVVLSTPQLWTSVSINTSRASEKGYTEFVRNLLLHSGGLPFSLTLGEGSYKDPSYIPEESAAEKELFSIINQSSHRWSRLNASLSDGQLGYLSDNTSVALSLRDIHLERFARFPNLKSSIFGKLTTRPTLRKVFVHNAHFQDIGISWDCVTHIDLSAFSIHCCLEIFRHAHQMTHFTLLSSYDRPPLAEPIVHGHLRVLAIFSSASESRSVVFDNLALPSLQELLIDHHLAKAASLVKRSGCNLTRLDVRESIFASTDLELLLVDLLEHLPSLTDLTLTHTPISNVFFKRLGSASSGIGAGNGGEFLPDLCSLKMCCEFRFDWESLADIFPTVTRPGLSEIEPGAPRRALRSFQLDVEEVDSDSDSDSDAGTSWHCRRIPEDVVMRLVAVRAGGVNMSIMDEYRRDLLAVSTEPVKAMVV
ncbi:unnamed protein product [Cyclocybe aegerita]|uniref:F-box domain-containing protein n=1 Tax=Cyclocybe aegerita TaxID=1973307 RepID=A0A8S0VRN1_CYCAE|nr:unnamed protein product [Cyclocybe aegerita]